MYSDGEFMALRNFKPDPRRIKAEKDEGTICLVGVWRVLMAFSEVLRRKVLLRRRGLKLILIHPVPEGIAGESQPFCRLRDIPGGLLKRLKNKVTLDLFQ